MIVDELKKSILNYAFKGKLTHHYSEEIGKILPKKYNSDDKKIKEVKDIKDLPSNWQLGKFGKYITLVSGQDLTKDRYYSISKDDSIPYLTGASNLSNGNVIINRYTNTPTSVANKGNILLTCKGTIGETAILDIERVHIARQFMAIVPNEMNTKYILYFLKNSIIELNRNAKSIIPGIDREFVLNLDLPIPPIEEQHRIVDVIEKLFSKLDEVKPIESKLCKLKLNFSNDMKNSILQSAVLGNLSERKESDINIVDYLHLIFKNIVISKDVTEKFYISQDFPKSWKLVKLGTICEVYGGKRIPAGRKLTNDCSGNAYIRVSDMNDYTVELDDIMYVPKDIFPLIKKYTISKEDLYITVAGTIGKVGFIPDELDGANLTENANKLVFYNINKKWLYYTLISPLIQHQINNFTTKVGQPKLAIKRIVNIEIPLPPLEEQQRIVDKLEQLLPLCNDIEQLIKES